MQLTRALDTIQARRAPSSFAERAVSSRLFDLERGMLEIVRDGRSTWFGRPAPDGLSAHVTIHDERFWRRALLGGSLGAAESYIEGEWDAADLTGVIRLFARNEGALSALESGASRFGLSLARIYHTLRKNTVEGSRRNIAAHYDLGNDFFARMLDPTMSYSAALFEPPESSLEEASLKKIESLCHQVDLREDDHLLEIGTGWGALAIHAASRYGCKVTTTTISREQHTFAKKRVQEAGLADRVTVLERDYRALEGRFSKIISVEMIEAVGYEHVDTFFAKCASLLLPGGSLAIQAITMKDQRFESAAREADFIKRYIFPGSCIPSATSLLQAATRSSDLCLRSFRDLTPHYAKTISLWRENLAPHRAEVIGTYGERFWRMWAYYLAYCEGGFRERYIGSAQLVFDRER